MKNQSFDLSGDIRNSERLGEGHFEWWNGVHERNHPFWLSGTSGIEVWKRLEVEHLLSPGARVLEVGVGLGFSAQALAERKCKVSALDISPVALKRVSSFATCFLADRLQELPPNAFDVAMSHLVAQHMTDQALEAQIKAVVASLKPKGVFAIQFSAYADELDHPHDETPQCAKSGGVYRSRNKMANMALAANAEPVKFIQKESFPEHKSCWHVLHLQQPRASTPLSEV